MLMKNSGIGCMPHACYGWGILGLVVCHMLAMHGKFWD